MFGLNINKWQQDYFTDELETGSAQAHQANDG